MKSPWPPASRLEIHRSVGDDNHNIANARLVCRSTIQADNSATRLARNSVGFESLAIGYIHNLYLLASNNVCSLQQIRVDGNATNIIYIRLCNVYSVNL